MPRAVRTLRFKKGETKSRDVLSVMRTVPSILRNGRPMVVCHVCGDFSMRLLTVSAQAVDVGLVDDNGVGYSIEFRRAFTHHAAGCSSRRMHRGNLRAKRNRSRCQHRVPVYGERW